MTERQKVLYEYLLERGECWTPQYQIARDLYADYGNAECCLEPKDYHDTAERDFITKDIRFINESPDFEKIIISCGRGVKIANEEEFDRYLANQYKATLRKLARVYKMAKKGGRHNQMDFGGHTFEAFLQGVDNE